MINAQVQKEIEEQNNVADLHQFMQENKQLMQYGIKKGALPKSIFDRPSLIRANLNANNSDLDAFVARQRNAETPISTKQHFDVQHLNPGTFHGRRAVPAMGGELH